MDKKGQTYYFNAELQKSSWTKPSAGFFILKATSRSDKAETVHPVNKSCGQKNERKRKNDGSADTLLTRKKGSTNASTQLAEQLKQQILAQKRRRLKKKQQKATDNGAMMNSEYSKVVNDFRIKGKDDCGGGKWLVR